VGKPERDARMGKNAEGLWDLLDLWLPLGCKSYNLKFFSVSVVLWVLWLARNKMVIEGVFVRNPTKLLQKVCVFSEMEVEVETC
jgi:hypothetical protein